MDITLLRPLVYTPEKDIKYFINHSDLPVLHSSCPADKTSDRENVKQLLHALDKENKGIKYRIFGAMQRAELDGYKVGGEFKNLKEESEE
jgi:tRNA(Ile)-lysidine synthase TilS/MesJ